MQQDLLLKIGLSKAQAAVYLVLLERGALSPPEVAELTGEKRTNAYMALDKLCELGVAKKDPDLPKVRYMAENPVKIKQLLLSQQGELKNTYDQLQAALPSLQSSYHLTHNQPGILYLDGVGNFKKVYDDIIRLAEPILILASVHDHEDPEVSKVIHTQITRQQEAGITSRVLLSVPQREAELETGTPEELAPKGVEVRYFGGTPYKTQVIIYGQNIAYTTFGKGVFTTIVTNEDLAQTQRALFENMWLLATK